MSRLSFTVPVRAVGVNDAFTGGDRPFVKTKAARAYAEAIGGCGALAVRRAHHAMFFGEAEVWIRFYFDSRRPDCDAAVKATLDALQEPTPEHPYRAGVYENDRQVIEHHVSKRIDRERPRVEIEVVEIAPPDAATLKQIERRRASPKREPIARPPTPDDSTASATTASRPPPRAGYAAADNLLAALHKKPARARLLSAQRRLSSSVRRYTP